MRKQTKFMAVLSAAAIMTAAAPMMTNYSGIYTSYAASKGGWKKTAAGTSMMKTATKKQTPGRKKTVNGFYLDENGDLAVSQRIDEYYVNSTGRMVKNQWVSVDNDEEYDSPDSPGGANWNYFGKDGKIVTSKWMTIGGKTYYFDEDGQMLTGLVEIDGFTYYLGNESDGSQKNRLGTFRRNEQTNTDDEGIWCYFDENGKMIMDQMDRKINGNYYTFIDGKMQ